MAVQINFDDCNLWLIDERLALHNFLVSDKTFSSMPITDSNSNKEPDVLCLQRCDKSLFINDGVKFPLASITLIEFKRPMRNDMKENKNPIDQCLDYLKEIREGKVKTSDGRLIPESKDIPAFCYIVTDLTSTMVDVCDKYGLNVTADRMRYFGYNCSRKAYMEVISYNLLNSVSERNQAFFTN
ncbi:hypothetical protein COMNV_01216 [Commensalibacter sp. Nvir]|uniref:hypothetical protein n=1 Tax=Commensalibacter sp. Nvir TaxID=3069817 RepID=UPI002D5E7F20|nr:hypothetical protein COMNV_01216 [Commensalibacter sp. Nvir]